MQEDLKTFIIEHPGTEDYLVKARRLRYLIEQLGYDTDTVIGQLDSGMAVLTQDGREIFSTTTVPKLNSLRFYLNIGG